MGYDNSLLTEILTESMSKEHITVIEKLSKPKHDEEIAAELNLKATVVRTLLNELHIKNLVEYERSKNKKTGWYTYLWKRREDKLDEYINAYLAGKSDHLNRQLTIARDGGLYSCGCNSVTMESAVETDFTCPDCNQMYVESDSKKIIKKLESEIKKVNKLQDK